MAVDFVAHHKLVQDNDAVVVEFRRPELEFDFVVGAHRLVLDYEFVARMNHKPAMEFDFVAEVVHTPGLDCDVVAVVVHTPGLDCDFVAEKRHRLVLNYDFVAGMIQN